MTFKPFILNGRLSLWLSSKLKICCCKEKNRERGRGVKEQGRAELKVYYVHIYIILENLCFIYSKKAKHKCLPLNHWGVMNIIRNAHKSHLNLLHNSRTLNALDDNAIILLLWLVKKYLKCRQAYIYIYVLLCCYSQWEKRYIYRER